MTPEQAIELVSRACAAFNGTLQDHQAIQQALQVIRGLVPQPQPEQKEELESNG